MIMTKKLKQFKVGDRVNDEYLGNGVVIDIIKSFYNSKVAQFYIVLFDKTPDVRYNMGNRECLVLPSSLKELL